MDLPLDIEIERIEWGFYARAKREAVLLHLWALPVLGLALLFGQTILGWVVAGAYVSRFAWVFRSWTHWRCPRCHQPYIRGRGWSGVQDCLPNRRCKHCGLPEYAAFLPELVRRRTLERPQARRGSTTTFSVVDDFPGRVAASLPQLSVALEARSDSPHSQMLAFLEVTRRAARRRNWQEYQRCVDLAAELLRTSDPDLENLIVGVFVAALDFDGSTEDPAWTLLPLDLQAVWKDLSDWRSVTTTTAAP